MDFIFKTAVVIVVTIILAYGFFISESFRTGPLITIESPIDGKTVTSPILIKGKIENASFASINDRRILVERGGDFKELISLPDGYNIIKLYASDKYNRHEEILINLIVKNQNASKKEDSTEEDSQKK